MTDTVYGQNANVIAENATTTATIRTLSMQKALSVHALNDESEVLQNSERGLQCFEESVCAIASMWAAVLTSSMTYG